MFSIINFTEKDFRYSILPAQLKSLFLNFYYLYIKIFIFKTWLSNEHFPNFVTYSSNLFPNKYEFPHWSIIQIQLLRAWEIWMKKIDITETIAVKSQGTNLRISIMERRYFRRAFIELFSAFAPIPLSSLSPFSTGDPSFSLSPSHFFCLLLLVRCARVGGGVSHWGG